VAARRTFGPVVLLGLASTGFAAVASNQTWATSDDPSAMFGAPPSGSQSPLALSLALAALAGWGVLLVLRGRVRRAVTWLVLALSVGALVTIVLAHSRLADDLAREYAEAPAPAVGFHGWYWIALACAVIAILAAGLAVRWVGTWPEMGSKYDAPGATGVPPEPETPLEIWKAIDEGRDPTA
jgi:hypothetical protein